MIAVALAGSLDGNALALADLALALALLHFDARQSLLAVVAAALPSGLAIFVWNSLVAAPSPPTAVALLVLAVVFLLAWRRPGVATLTFAFIGAAALLAHLGARELGEAPALLATVRTALLAAGAVGLALLSRAVPAAAHLVYPALALAAAKLLWEDFRVGVAATLFIDFALVGVALIVAPRVRAGARKA
jgi:hypothetical protein